MFSARIKKKSYGTDIVFKRFSLLAMLIYFHQLFQFKGHQGTSLFEYSSNISNHRICRLSYINEGLACFEFFAGMCGSQCDHDFKGTHQKITAEERPWNPNANNGLVLLLQTSPGPALVLFFPPTKANRRRVGHQRASMPSGHPGAKAYLSSGNISPIQITSW